MARQATHKSVDISVDATVDLTNSINDLRVADGARVAVGGSPWYLDKASAATIDGVTAVATFSGVGRWLSAAGVLAGMLDDRVLDPTPPAPYDDLATFVRTVESYTPTGTAATDTAGIATALALIAGKGEVAIEPPSATTPLAINAPRTIVTKTRARSRAGQEMRSTTPGVTPADALFYAPYTLAGNNGTLAANAVLVGTSAVFPAGTAPPVITLTGTALPTVKCVFVRCTLGGARDTWEGECSVDGTTWTAFVSAAIVVMTGSGLTLNIAVGVANTNNQWTATASGSLRLTIGSPPSVGNFLSIEHGTSQAQYEVMAVFSGVVALERPIVWPFVAADTVREVTTVPTDVVLDMRGAPMTGIGGQAIEYVGALRPVVLDMVYDGTTAVGCVQGSALGYDCSCRDGLLDGGNFRQPNGSAPVYYQSNERSTARRGLAIGCGYSFALFDSYQSTIENWWSVGATVGGIVIDQIDGTTFGCIECAVIGGGFLQGKGAAVMINASARCFVDGHYVDGADIGFWAVGSPGTRFSHCSARNCQSSAVQVNTGSSQTFVDNMVIAASAYGLRVNSGSVDTFCSQMWIKDCTTYAVFAEGDLTIAGLRLENTAGGTTAPVLVGNCRFCLSSAYLTSAKGNASVIQVTAGISRLRDVRIEMVTGANQTALYLTGGVIHLESVSCGGIASSYSLYIAGATVRIGTGCVLDSTGTTGTPFYLGSGTCTMDPQPGVSSVAMADAAQNIVALSAKWMVAIIECTGALTLDRALTLPKITGYVWTINNKTTGGNNIVATVAGTTVNCAAGITRVYWDGTNVVQA